VDLKNIFKQTLFTLTLVKHLTFFWLENSFY